jgi:hypothetical protein
VLSHALKNFAAWKASLADGSRDALADQTCLRGTSAHTATHPPSTAIVRPVIKLLASLARNNRTPSSSSSSPVRLSACFGASTFSANPYHHLEETRVNRFVVSSNRDSARFFRFRSLNEQIHDADDRAAFVRSGRVREKNLFPNTGDATDLIEWHMPLVPVTISNVTQLCGAVGAVVDDFFGTAVHR